MLLGRREEEERGRKKWLRRWVVHIARSLGGQGDGDEWEAGDGCGYASRRVQRCALGCVGLVR